MTRARTYAACLDSATASIISFPRGKDHDKQALCNRLDRAASLYFQRAMRSAANPAAMNREWAEQCLSYRKDIQSGDPLSYALLRHLATGLCEFIEAREL